MIYHGFIQCKEGEWHNLSMIAKFYVTLAVGNEHFEIGAYMCAPKERHKISITGNFKTYEDAINALEEIMTRDEAAQVGFYGITGSRLNALENAVRDFRVRLGSFLTKPLSAKEELEKVTIQLEQELGLQAHIIEQDKKISKQRKGKK